MKKMFILAFVMAPGVIVCAQNVGIGTVAPAEKLHVAGNIKSDTIKPNAIKFLPNAGAGKLLTSDAAGNASWQGGANGVGAGTVGFGAWGDCSMNNISEYNPVADEAGETDDHFGYSVSISGNYAIIGAPRDDVGANANQGSASIYRFNGSNWVPLQKLTDATGAADDNFGQAVSISEDFAIVGAPNDDVGASVDQGSVSIFHYDGSSWVLMQKITDASGAAGDYFGNAVCVSQGFAIIGSPLDDVGANANQGSASIYQFSLFFGNWLLMQKITDPVNAAGDAFGSAVSIFGNTFALVGTPNDDLGVNGNQGSATAFRYNGTNWEKINQLVDVSNGADDNFGASVSIFGNYAIVGAPMADETNVNQGSATFFQYSGGFFTKMDRLTDANGATNDFFGSSVSLSGNYAIVGTTGTDMGANSSQGSATAYQRMGQGWQKLQYITDPGGSHNNLFGKSAAIDHVTKRFVIGAYNSFEGKGKAVFGKIN